MATYKDSRAGIYTNIVDQTYITRRLLGTTVAMVGDFLQGPVDEPVLITSIEDADRIFGADTGPGYTPRNSLETVLLSGAPCWVARANPGGSPTTGYVVLQAEDAALDEDSVIDGLKAGKVANPFAETGGSAPDTNNVKAVTFKVLGPGKYSSNYWMDIVSSNVKAPVAAGAEGSTTVTTTDAVPAGETKYKVSAFNNDAEIFAATATEMATADRAIVLAFIGSPSSNIDGYNVYRQRPGASTWQRIKTFKVNEDVGEIGAGAATAMAKYGTVGSNIAVFETAVVDTGVPKASIGDNKVYVFIDDGTATGGAVVDENDPIYNDSDMGDLKSNVAHEFTVNFYDYRVSKTQAIQTHVCSLSNRTSAGGAQTEIESAINLPSSIFRVQNEWDAEKLDAPLVYSVAKTQFAAGDDGNDMYSLEEFKTALDKYADPVKYPFDLFIQAGVLASGTATSIPFALEIRSLIESDAKRGGGIDSGLAVLDVPMTLAAQEDAVNYRSQLGISSRNMILVNNWARATSKNALPINLAPSAAYAFVAANTDDTVGRHFSPAGARNGQLTIASNSQENITYRDDDRDKMKSAQINYFEFVPGRGVIMKEAVTLQKDASVLQWVSVSRTLKDVTYVTRAILEQFVLQNIDVDTIRRAEHLVNRELEGLVSIGKLQAASVNIQSNEAQRIAGELNVRISLAFNPPIDRIVQDVFVTPDGQLGA